ncbi:MAG: cob(I)yrinic acid a,c-diamide adenosyltransferase [Chitinophagales bacterium]|jgi:cob(I)alamin adenosyltransferase|nr:cob(I)yrinic acid a,c-diamide adenosyltransferase [Chitinophagales bacterium]
MKIYTKTGDDGTTSLFGGDRVLKSNKSVDIYGSLDELNSQIGMLYSLVDDLQIHHDLQCILNTLFNLSSYVATSKEDFFEKLPVLEEKSIDMLENRIDKIQELLPALNQFVLPVGDTKAAQAHIVRTTCRRVERLFSSLDSNLKYYDFGLRYLNRLSDYCFVLGRHLTLLSGVGEIYWNKEKTY